MKPLAISLLLLLVATVDAGPAWEPNVIGNVRIEVPTDSKKNVQSTLGAGGAVQSMKNYSFRNRLLDLELVFLTFPPGTGGNLDGAAANMTAQLKAASGAESLTPWKATTVSGRPARHIATRPDRTHQARVVTLIDDTKATNQLVIVDVSYDASSSSGKADSERIMRSVVIK